MLARGSLEAQGPESDVARVFGEIERLEREQVNKTADVIRVGDRRAHALAPSVLRWGHKVIPPLEAIARDAGKPAKTRQLAVSVIGLTRDPGAFPPLRAMLLDSALPDGLRSEAAVGLGGTTVSKAARREAFCSALREDALPPQALREALIAVSTLGCDDAALLERRARLLSLSPNGADAERARLILAALGRTPAPEAGDALWRLFGDYAAGSPQREAALTALLADPARLAALGSRNEPRALRAVSEESGRAENAVLAARLAARVGTPRCADALRRLLRHGDAEVVAEAAEGLARLKWAKAKKDLAGVVERAHDDARFAPKPGRPDPAIQLARVRAALAQF